MNWLLLSLRLGPVHFSWQIWHFSLKLEYLDGSRTKWLQTIWKSKITFMLGTGLALVRWEYRAIFGISVEIRYSDRACICLTKTSISRVLSSRMTWFQLEIKVDSKIFLWTLILYFSPSRRSPFIGKLSTFDSFSQMECVYVLILFQAWLILIILFYFYKSQKLIWKIDNIPI